MGLYIKQDQEENERNLNRWFGSRKKFAYVYKILVKQEDENLYRSFTFSDFIWDFSRQKVFEVERPKKPTEFELNPDGLDFGEIHKGFHVYTSLEAAGPCANNYITVKFKVLKEDIIAINNLYGQAVCRKLTFVKIIED
jgi:outer membrane receptor for Fe3+-dicitrate